MRYVTCAVCGEKIRAEDDDEYGEDAYFLLGEWICTTCVNDAKQEAKQGDGYV